MFSGAGDAVSRWCWSLSSTLLSTTIIFLGFHFVRCFVWVCNVQITKGSSLRWISHRRQRLGSSSSLSFWRYSLLGVFSLQRRVERVLSPSLLSGSRVQIPVILSLATDGKVSTLILSALINRSWNIDLNVQTPPFRLREVVRHLTQQRSLHSPSPVLVYKVSQG
ncbi:unnamed protein product [Brassica oleracea]